MQRNDSPNQVETRHPWPNRSYAWFVVFLLFLAYTISFVDRQILSLMVDPVKQDLGLSDFEISLLHGFAFGLFYSLFGLPLGFLADRFNRRNLIVTGITLWSIMTYLCGLAIGFKTLFLARMGVGVGEATLSPSAYSILSDYFPPQHLGKAVSVYSTGISAGIGLAFIAGGIVVSLVNAAGGVTLPVIGEVSPWRAAFMIVAMPGILVALILMLVREPRRRGRLSARRRDIHLKKQVGELWAFCLERKEIYGPFIMGLSLLTLLSHGFAAWIPSFFARTFGMAIGTVGITYGIIYLIFGTLGTIFGGWLADHKLARGDFSAGISVPIIGAITIIPVGLLAPLVSSPTLAFALISILTFAILMPFGVAGAALQMITPNEYRGQVAAIYLFSINLIGLGFGPTLIAASTDYIFNDPSDLRYSMVLIFAVISPVALFTLLKGREAFTRGARAMLAADIQRDSN